ncbi:hypothetical protein MMC13_003740 [Lambiella insularis]|nr:hypothetical protein [Lambiella insularis]
MAEHNMKFVLFHHNFFIPVDIAKEWHLSEDPKINVQWDVAPEAYEDAFGPESGPEDEGRRLGIRIFKQIDGMEKSA